MTKAALDFDRYDYGAARALLLGAVVVAPAVLVALPVLAWASGDPVTWTVLVDDAAPTGGPAVGDQVRAVWDGVATVTVDDPTAGLRWATLLPSLVLAVATVLVAWSLLGLVRTIQRGASFTAGAVTRLRVVAVTLLLAPWLHAAASGLADSLVLERALGGPQGLSVAVGGMSLAVSALGLAVGAVGEAFRQGVALRDDVDGLV